MTARTYKCPDCGAKNIKEETIAHNKRHYCRGCYEALQQRKKEREYLLSVISKLYGLDANNKLDGRLLKDLKDLGEEGYSYRDVYLTLMYCKDVLKLTFDVKYALGCVRFYRKDCLNHLKKIQNISNKSSSLEPLKIRTVVAKREAYKPNLSHKLISIEEL